MSFLGILIFHVILYILTSQLSLYKDSKKKNKKPDCDYLRTFLYTEHKHILISEEQRYYSSPWELRAWLEAVCRLHLAVFGIGMR